MKIFSDRNTHVIINDSQLMAIENEGQYARAAQAQAQARNRRSAGESYRASS